MERTGSLLNSVRSLEGVLLITLSWIGIGWFLVNRTPIPNDVFVVGSIGVAIAVVWITLRTLPKPDE